MISSTNTLDQKIIDTTKNRIENSILPLMEKVYLHGSPVPEESFKPDLKPIERIVSYYDYAACGISVLATLAANGNKRALKIIDIIRNNCTFYMQNIHKHHVPGLSAVWNVPLRRLLTHLAFTYERLAPSFPSHEIMWIKEIIFEQIPLVIEHNHNFFPGVKDLHITTANNHTAIFMQGLYHCGRVFGVAEWKEMAIEFATRFYESGHPDGYWEEHTNIERDGGPSLLYTRLTAGCLYDTLSGNKNNLEKFYKAGKFYRQFLNSDFSTMPIADERANANSYTESYGIALHSLTAEGRGFLLHVLQNYKFDNDSPETLAVIYNELELIKTGECSVPENLTSGHYKPALPIGVVRQGKFTACISALRALNRELFPTNDYALDHQTMVYLHHKDIGVVLSGFKSKGNPEFSTFRIGSDAYTIKTGELSIDDRGAKARLFYATFEADILLELNSESVRLIFRSETDRTITTAIPIVNSSLVKNVSARYALIDANEFSPYNDGNRGSRVTLFKTEWKNELIIDFAS